MVLGDRYLDHPFVDLRVAPKNIPDLVCDHIIARKPPCPLTKLIVHPPDASGVAGDVLRRLFGIKRFHAP